MPRPPSRSQSGGFGNDKEASVAGAEWVRGRVVGDEVCRCDRLKMAPQRNQALVSGTCKCYLTW